MNSKYPEFVKYERIPHLMEMPQLLDKEVEVYEKLDGGNAQVRTHRGRTLAGNRSTYLTDNFVKSKSYIPECRWFGNLLKWALSDYSLLNLPENVVVFGEWLGKHTLDYSEEHKDKFYLIDVLDLNNNRFLPYGQSKHLLNQAGVKDVNFLRNLAKGKVDLERLENLVKRSDYRDGQMEGLVVKDYSSQQFAKLWESSINRKKKIVTSDDVRRAVLSMVDAEKIIDEDNVAEELFLDLIRQNMPYSRSTIDRAVRSYFSNPLNLT